MKLRRSLLSCSLLVLTACANTSFQQIGSSVLSSTGLVSGSQADAIFAAGGKLAKAATPLSEEEEYYLGRGVSATILGKYSLSSDRELTQYLNRVGAVVSGNSNRPETFGGYHVALLETPEVNAVSAPGGYIFITRGLLNVISTEDELSAVLAHEVGHIALAHGVGAISQAHMTEALSILGKEAASSYAPGQLSQLTSVFADSVKQVTETLLTKGYSRSQEYAADEYAAELLKRSGYNAKALVSMLQAVEVRQSGAQGGWYDTHPAASNRISQIEGAVSSAPVPSNEGRRTKRFAAARK